MQISTAFSEASDTAQAIAEVLAQVGANCAPSLLVVSFSATHDAEAVRSAFSNAYGCALHGASSCRGLMTEAGHSVATGNGLGVLCLDDPEGDFGTGASSFEDGARSGAARAAELALGDAGRTGEAPDLVWVSATPGAEEDVIAGIQDVFGPDVPIVGGSAADNTVSGDWRLFDRSGVRADGVVVTVLFSSGHVSDAFQNGYSPTEHAGTVTRSGGRRILEIDGKPAADVYAEWTGGAVLEAAPEETTNILGASTRWPLGRMVTRRDNREDFILVHPAAVHPDGSIDVFAEVAEGTLLTQMTGTSQALISRAGQVAGLSRYATERVGHAPRGALVVFCGGCMLSVQDEMDGVLDSIRDAIGELPFLGVFTFGEQGRMPVGGNLHGNLMISCVTFGE